MDITIKHASANFGVRAVALFLHQGHVLLHQTDGERIWNLPGGRTRLMETTADALRREMQEELGTSIRVGPLQWTVELLFTLDGTDHHEVGFYYLAEFEAPARYRLTEPFRGAEGALGITFRWFPIDEIDQVPNLVPLFLGKALKALPCGHRHIVEYREQ